MNTLKEHYKTNHYFQSDLEQTLTSNNVTTTEESGFESLLRSSGSSVQEEQKLNIKFPGNCSEKSFSIPEDFAMEIDGQEQKVTIQA